MIDAPIEDGDDHIDEAPEPTVEEKALAMGWTPLDQFKGDPAKFVDPETFVKRGEEFVPFLKANNRQLEKALEKATKEIAGLKTTMTEFADHNSKTEQRAYARALNELKAEQAAAAKAGDVEAVQDITERMVDLKAEVRAPSAGNGADPALEAWKADNGWFEKDSVLRGYAMEIDRELRAAGVTDNAYIRAEAAKRVKAEFPDRTGDKPADNPRRREAGAVEGGTPNVRRTGKSYADLPSDAKSACDSFVKTIPGFTRDKYVKDYFQ